MTARDHMTLPDRSPTPRRFPSPDLPTEIIPVATAASVQAASAAPTVAHGGTADSDDSDGKFNLSLTQIVASTAAAVTAALIGSRLGVAGTLVGAALASIVSGVGAAIYSHSLLVTRRQMKKALLLVRPPDGTTVAAVAVSGGAHAAPRPVRAPVSDDELTVLMPAVIPPRAPRRAPGRRRTVTAALAGVAAAGVIFAGAMATVTLVETVKGAPLSGGDSGLSVLGGNGSSGTSTDPTTVTVTSPATSADAPETATVTQTVTQSPTVSSEPSAPTTDPTTDPSTVPTSAGAAANSAPAAAGRPTSGASVAGQGAPTAVATS